MKNMPENLEKATFYNLRGLSYVKQQLDVEAGVEKEDYPYATVADENIENL